MTWRAAAGVDDGEITFITVKLDLKPRGYRGDGRAVPPPFSLGKDTLVAYGQTARSALNNLLTFSEEGGR